MDRHGGEGEIISVRFVRVLVESTKHGYGVQKGRLDESHMSCILSYEN